MRLLTKIVLTSASVLMLSACALTGGQPPAPTVDTAPTLNAVRTQAAETVEAELASQPTATSLPPTSTLAPSATELPTFTPVPTEVPVIPTSTPPPTNTPAPQIIYTNTPTDYTCTITASSPASGYTFVPGADFDARWTVKNTGNKTWATSEIDYRFLSGEATYAAQSGYDIPKNVAPGESVEIIVDMLAPTTVGNHSTTWSLSYGSSAFCTLPLRFNVK